MDRYSPDHVLATRVSADEFRVMAASVHHLQCAGLRRVCCDVGPQASVHWQRDAADWRRRSVRAKSQMTEGHVIQKEAIRSFRHDLLDLHCLTQW